MDTAHFKPKCSQVFCSLRHLGVKNFFKRLTVCQAVTERADAAGPLNNILIIVEISLFCKHFKSSVHKSHRRNCLNNLFILKHKVDVYRLRQNRMLRTKRYNRLNSHYSLSSFLITLICFLKGVSFSIR